MLRHPFYEEKEDNNDDADIMGKLYIMQLYFSGRKEERKLKPNEKRLFMNEESLIFFLYDCCYYCIFFLNVFSKAFWNDLEKMTPIRVGSLSVPEL